MKPSVLFVCYDGYNTTNARVRCYRFAKELESHDILARVFSFKDDLNASYDGYQSSKVGRAEQLTLVGKALLYLLKEPASTIFYIQKAGYFALAPFIVHLLKGNKYILDYDDYEYEQSILSKYLLRLLARRAKCCIAASRYLQIFLKQFNSDVYYIPTGVDMNIFKRRNPRSPGKKIVFTWAGILVDEDAAKNLEFIVDCFDIITKRNKSALLWIVGGGEYMPKIEAHLAQLKNVSIQYLGKIPPDEMPDYLLRTDVGLFVLGDDTKYNRSKSPTKLFEYMAVGLVPICTKIGESGRIIQDGKTGLLVHEGKSIIVKAESLINHPRLLTMIGDSAHQDAKRRFSLEVLGNRLSLIIKRIHKQHG